VPPAGKSCKNGKKSRLDRYDCKGSFARGKFGLQREKKYFGLSGKQSKGASKVEGWAHGGQTTYRGGRMGVDKEGNENEVGEGSIARGGGGGGGVVLFIGREEGSRGVIVVSATIKREGRQAG